MTKSNSQNYALLLDSGNTRLKIAAYDIQNKCFVGNTYAIEHQEVNKQNIQLFLNNLSNNQDSHSEKNIKIAKILGVNVAGSNKEKHINNVFLSLLNINPSWITVRRTQATVLNHYKNLKQLGVDRWVSMVGISTIAKHTDQACVLANFGTATTIDTLVPTTLFNRFSHNNDINEMIDPESNHSINLEKTKWHFIGGTILPGPTLMAKSLETNTANLPNATGITSEFPLETFQAISSGIAGAQAGAVLRQWQAAHDKYKTSPKLYISGGGASIVKQELEGAIKKAQTLNNIKACAISELEAPIMNGLATFIFD